MAYRHISLPQPFVHGDPNEWFKRFEICCRANAWDNAAQAAKLPTLLEGEALAMWLELEEAEQGNYDVAKNKIVKRIAPPGPWLCITGRLPFEETATGRGTASLPP